MPVCETDRLIIKKNNEVTAEQVWDIWDYASSPGPNVLWKPHHDVYDTILYVTNAKNDYFLEYDSSIVGAVNLSPIDERCERWHIGYIVHQYYQHFGICTEAVMALTDWSFKNMPIHRIEAIPRVENIASRKVLEKCGFESEGIMKDGLKLNGTFYDVMMYGKINR